MIKGPSKLQLPGMANIEPIGKFSNLGKRQLSVKETSDCFQVCCEKESLARSQSQAP